MLRRRSRRGVQLGLAGMLMLPFVSGCAVNRLSASVTPGSNVGQLKRLYVERFGPDQRGINQLIQVKLVRLGYTATTGPEGQAPEDVDAIVTYRDKWVWDMAMYMLELTVTIRDPKNEYPLAVGNAYHTSLTRRSPEEMVDEVLTEIFNKANNPSQMGPL